MSSKPLDTPRVLMASGTMAHNIPIIQTHGDLTSFLGFCSGHWGQYFDAELEHNGELTRGKGYLPDECTDRAMDFMTANVERDQPFFCYLPYNIPHTPFQVPDEFYDPFRDKPIEMRATNPDQEEIVAHAGGTGSM